MNNKEIFIRTKNPMRWVTPLLKGFQKMHNKSPNIINYTGNGVKSCRCTKCKTSEVCKFIKFHANAFVIFIPHT